MRYAALRGTLGDFKGEVTGSDKHYSFSISAPQESGRLHLFESAIDLLSYATLTLGRGWDWQKDSLLSLAGVYQTKRENVVPIALSRYLQEIPTSIPCNFTWTTTRWGGVRRQVSWAGCKTAIRC